MSSTHWDWRPLEAKGTFVSHDCTIWPFASSDQSVAWRLVRLFVDPRYRRRGLARAIVNHLIETVQHRGYRRLLVETNDDWTDALGLYRACGFIEEGRHDGEIHFSLDLA